MSRKKKGDSHLYDPPERVECGFHVLLGVLNGTARDMTDKISSMVCTREALRSKKKLTKPERELLSFCSDTTDSQQGTLRSRVIKGPGRGKGMWIRHGALNMAAFEEGHIRGLWTILFKDAIRAYGSKHTVVLLTLEVWKTQKQGRPSLLGWNTVEDESDYEEDDHHECDTDEDENDDDAIWHN